MSRYSFTHTHTHRQFQSFTWSFSSNLKDPKLCYSVLLFFLRHMVIGENGVYVYKFQTPFQLGDHSKTYLHNDLRERLQIIGLLGRTGLQSSVLPKAQSLPQVV